MPSGLQKMGCVRTHEPPVLIQLWFKVHRTFMAGSVAMAGMAGLSRENVAF
jgi:hypothetical protein